MERRIVDILRKRFEDCMWYEGSHADIYNPNSVCGKMKVGI